MSLELVRNAAFDILTGRETPNSLRVLKSAQAGIEQVRQQDPETYHFFKRAMIEKMKRQIRRAAA